MTSFPPNGLARLSLVRMPPASSETMDAPVAAVDNMELGSGLHKPWNSTGEQKVGANCSSTTFIPALVGVGNSLTCAPLQSNQIHEKYNYRYLVGIAGVRFGISTPPRPCPAWPFRADRLPFPRCSLQRGGFQNEGITDGRGSWNQAHLEGRQRGG